MPNAPASWEIGLIGGPEKRVVEIVSYKEDWPVRFQHEAPRIRNVLGSTARQIEHIGSTSVPGLAAKPIIDILTTVSDPAQEHLYLPHMLSLGYELRVREPDFEEHRMFRTPQRDVHVHIYPVGSVEIERYLLFRQTLRAHRNIRDAYAVAKTTFIEAAIQHP